MSVFLRVELALLGVGDVPALSASVGAIEPRNCPVNRVQRTHLWAGQFAGAAVMVYPGQLVMLAGQNLVLAWEKPAPAPIAVKAKVGSANLGKSFISATLPMAQRTLMDLIS